MSAVDSTLDRVPKALPSVGTGMSVYNVKKMVTSLENVQGSSKRLERARVQVENLSFMRDLLGDDTEMRGMLSSETTEREDVVPRVPDKNICLSPW